MIVLWKHLIAMIRQGIPCLFRCMTGLYCPGCGGTRAVKYLLHGQIGKSLWYHPLVVYMAAVLIVEAGGYLAARWSGNRSLNPGIRPGHYEKLTCVGVAVILVNWAVKNLALLVWGIEMIP